MSATATPRQEAAPAATIAAAILMPQDRIPREPLGPWAARLLETLDQGLATIRTTRRFAGELGFVGNNAGLIAAHRGEMQTAWRITERQVWWHGRQARRSGDAAVTAYGLQPWVNLGRLDALTGRWHEALARFAGLAAYEVAGRLELGCVRVGGSAWAAVTESREQFLDVLETMYVSDSLKAMLLNRRFELVHPFVARCVPEGGLRWVCEEACAVAEAREGDFGAAAARAEAAARGASGWNRAVLRRRAAEAHACAGDTARAAGILAQVAGVVAQVSPEQKARPELMPVTTRLATACHEVGLDAQAYAVARGVLEGARAVRDELIEIELLRLLAVTAPDGEREEWRRAAEAAAETTEYARYRRGGPPPPSPATEELYARLLDAFAS